MDELEDLEGIEIDDRNINNIRYADETVYNDCRYKEEIRIQRLINTDKKY